MCERRCLRRINELVQLHWKIEIIFIISKIGLYNLFEVVYVISYAKRAFKDAAK